ncbi:hybrid sensor histidine kinase/response regulator [Leptolyngbya valderiana BDU 20041]|nr:hybrid sensor histidine kinase/response regulator [Leptolyngbya valderiana BDU 20041]
MLDSIDRLNKPEFDWHPQEPILIVDDNPNNLKVLAQALKSGGWTVAMAKSGKIAIEQVLHRKPALILLDIMMPEMDGFETCKTLKSNPQTAEIPIIFMTALSETVDKVKGLSLGAVDYITKPFQAEEVLARVKIQLKLYALTKQLEVQNQTLEERVSERTIELNRSLEELKQAQLQLVQHEKMATLGQLMAGIGHEINNPIGFIGGNITVAQEYVEDLLHVIDCYQEELPNPSPQLTEELEEVEIEFVAKDLTKLLQSMKSGVERIYNISTSLRSFARTDNHIQTEFDLHEGLDSTLLILKYRLKANENRPAIEVIKKYGELPTIWCYPGQLNQVFLNILANAIDALDEKSSDRTFADLEARPNRIILQTEVSEDGRSVTVWIRDNGVGMSEEVRGKIFDSGFTTKAVGRGTGLGMAISRQIIEGKHRGSIGVESTVGDGTTFSIVLPLDPEDGI